MTMIYGRFIDREKYAEKYFTRENIAALAFSFKANTACALHTSPTGFALHPEEQLKVLGDCIFKKL